VYRIDARSLTITSQHPARGVSVMVAPNDVAGQGNGATPFTRSYNDNTAVTLTAPASAGGNTFQKWQMDGVDFSTSVGTTLVMDAHHTMTAVYSLGASYIGNVDHAWCDNIRGWAADRNRLNTSINVQIYDGTTLIGTVLANQSRPDIGSSLGDNGLHGFNFTTPASLQDGAAHAVHVKFEASITELGNS